MFGSVTEFFARQAFDQLWSMVWHFGILIGIIVCACLWVFFVPVYRKVALLVAVMATVVLLTAGIYSKLGADYVQAKWEAAKQADVMAAERARAEAEAAVPAVVPGADHAPFVRGDAFDRDAIACSDGKRISAYHLFGSKGHSGDSAAGPRSQCNGQKARAVEIVVYRGAPYKTAKACQADLLAFLTLAKQYAPQIPIVAACKVVP